MIIFRSLDGRSCPECDHYNKPNVSCRTFVLWSHSGPQCPSNDLTSKAPHKTKSAFQNDSSNCNLTCMVQHVLPNGRVQNTKSAHPTTMRSDLVHIGIRFREGGGHDQNAHVFLSACSVRFRHASVVGTCSQHVLHHLENKRSVLGTR